MSAIDVLISLVVVACREAWEKGYRYALEQAARKNSVDLSVSILEVETEVSEEWVHDICADQLPILFREEIKKGSD